MPRDGSKHLHKIREKSLVKWKEDYSSSNGDKYHYGQSQEDLDQWDIHHNFDNFFLWLSFSRSRQVAD